MFEPRVASIEAAATITNIEFYRVRVSIISFRREVAAHLSHPGPVSRIIAYGSVLDVFCIV